MCAGFVRHTIGFSHGVWRNLEPLLSKAKNDERAHQECFDMVSCVLHRDETYRGISFFLSDEGASDYSVMTFVTSKSDAGV